MERDDSQLRNDIETYSDMVLRIAVSNTKNYHDARDIVQEVFLRLMNSYDNIKSCEHKKAWLIRVTVNLCHDAVRRERFCSFEPLENYPCIDEGIYSDIELFDIIRRLPENQRNALYLHFFEGLSIEEIAEITGRSRGTVGSDIHRAKKRIKLEYEQ